MGAKAILFSIWLIGYALGFFAYLAFPTIAQTIVYWLPQLFTDTKMVGAFLTGIAGSTVSTISVILWGYLSKTR